MATVTNQTEFKNAVAALAPEIVVANNISLTSPTTIGYTVTIKAERGASLIWSGPTVANPSMLIISQAGNLSIENITFDAENRDGTFVQINGGTFMMNDGSALRNIKSTRANSAVVIASLTTNSGGTFIMNSGLITGIDASDAVFCSGGSIIMNNGASVSGNMAAGVSMTAPLSHPEKRPSLTMTGLSSISNNKSKDAGGAGILMNADVVMGLNEGDAPAVSGNSTPYYAGAWFLSDDSVLTMRYGAEISGNFAPMFSGGISAQRTSVSLYDNASIKDNKSDGEAGGILISSGCSMLLDGNSQVSGNGSKGRGGGIYMQSGAELQIKGYSSIFGNMAANGAGIYLNGSLAAIGLDNSSPKIYENSATGLGGGIYISANSVLNLVGQASITDNTAIAGCGIYKLGRLNLLRSPIVSDGLYFDDLTGVKFMAAEQEKEIEEGHEADALPASSTTADSNGLRRQLSPEPLIIEANPMRSVASEASVSAYSIVLNDAYTDNVPVIEDILTSAAFIQLESSGYVSPENVPLVIAEKGADYNMLGDTDRAAWRIPSSFGEGYSVILNPERNWVLIDVTVFNIYYYCLFGVENPNPDTYSIKSDLPITLSDPGKRPGYIFTGWYDGEGLPVYEIPEGMTGDFVLVATWKEEQKSCVIFNENAPCVYSVPEPVCGEEGEVVTIPIVIPKKMRHCFAGWNTSPLGYGDSYAPDDPIRLTEENITLYALWQPICKLRRGEGNPLYCPYKKHECAPCELL